MVVLSLDAANAVVEALVTLPNLGPGTPRIEYTSTPGTYDASTILASFDLSSPRAWTVPSNGIAQLVDAPLEERSAPNSGTPLEFRVLNGNNVSVWGGTIGSGPNDGIQIDGPIEEGNVVILEFMDIQSPHTSALLGGSGAGTLRMGAAGNAVNLAPPSGTQAVLNFSQDDGTRATTPPATLMAPAMVIVDGWGSSVGEGWLVEGRLQYRFNDQGTHLTAVDPDSRGNASGLRVAAYGVDRDISQEQQGWVAANLYLTPQTTSVELEVQDRQGLFSGLSSIDSRTITIAPNTRTQVHISNAGNDTTGDGSVGNPYATPDHVFNPANGIIGDNTYVRFNRGDVFPTSATMACPYFNVVIGEYGTGDRPEIRWESNALQGVVFNMNGSRVCGIMSLQVTLNTTGLNYNNVSNNRSVIFGMSSSDRGWIYDCRWAGEPGTTGEQAFGGIIGYLLADGLAVINCEPIAETNPSGRRMGVSARQCISGGRGKNYAIIGTRLAWSAGEHIVRNIADALAPPILEGYMMTWCDLRSDIDWIIGSGGFKTIRYQYGNFCGMYQCGAPSIELSFDGAHLDDTLLDGCFFDSQDISNVNGGGPGNSTHLGCELGSLTHRTIVRACISYRLDASSRRFWLSDATQRPGGWTPEGPPACDDFQVLFNALVQGDNGAYYPRRMQDFYLVGTDNPGNTITGTHDRMVWFGNYISIPANFTLGNVNNHVWDTNDIGTWAFMSYSVFPTDARYGQVANNDPTPSFATDVSLGNLTFPQAQNAINNGGGTAINNVEEDMDDSDLLPAGFLPGPTTAAYTAAIPRIAIFQDYRGVEYDPNAATWPAGAINLETP